MTRANLAREQHGEMRRDGGLLFPTSAQCPLPILATVQACSWGGWAGERVCGGLPAFPTHCFWPGPLWLAHKIPTSTIPGWSGLAKLAWDRPYRHLGQALGGDLPGGE